MADPASLTQTRPLPDSFGFHRAELFQQAPVVPVSFALDIGPIICKGHPGDWLSKLPEGIAFGAKTYLFFQRLDDHSDHPVLAASGTDHFSHRCHPTDAIPALS